MAEASVSALAEASVLALAEASVWALAEASVSVLVLDLVWEWESDLALELASASDLGWAAEVVLFHP